MDKSQKDRQPIPPHLEQKNLIEFLESLHRIFKIGIYYPAGHKVLDHAAKQFQRNFLGVADTKRSVFIELQSEALLVESHEIKKLTIALQEFKKLLFDLGIATIEIDRTILLPELLQLVRTLLLGRSKLQGIKEFTRAEIDTLPASVRISQKNFLVDKNAILLDDNVDDTENGLADVFQVLAEQGFGPEKIEQCKTFLHSLSKKISIKPFNVQGLPTVTWNDVRGLLIKAASKASHFSGSPDGEFAKKELNAISAIFTGLEMEVQDKASQETINLLTSVFSGTSSVIKQHGDGAYKLKKIRPSDNISLQSAAQLQSFVDENYVSSRTLEKINRFDRREELAIALQLLQFKQEPAVAGKIRQVLQIILSTPLNDGETEILIKGVINLATFTDNSSHFYDTVRFLAIFFRSCTVNFPSQHFLVTICQKLSPAEQILIWPILVNEILVIGRTADRKVFEQLVHLAAGLPGGEMKGRWQELEAMDCFQEKKIAADIFDPELKNGFPIFSFLLETSMKRQIGARILGSLKENPSDWLIEAVAQLLQLEVPQHMKFLQIYLLAAQKGYFPVNLRMAAGTLVAHELPEIAAHERKEAWVVKTIEATPEIQVELTPPLLNRIIKEKRLAIVPKWPNACRRAAAEALKKLSSERRKLNGITWK
jgi:hypothetical protein